MIELENVGVRVGRRILFTGCSATFANDSVTHLTAPNGSGKTSLVRAIAGIQRYSGVIRVGDAPGARDRSSLYVCFDDAAVIPFLSGCENIRILTGRRLPRAAIERAAGSILDPPFLRSTARRLSSGQRKRLHLVAALLSGAENLIFDEALEGVDAPTLAEVAGVLDGSATVSTVILTGHSAESVPAGLAPVRTVALTPEGIV